MAEENVNPSAPPAGGQENAGTAPNGDGSGFSRADFLDRARREPDWAAEQIRQFQSDRDRALAAQQAAEAKAKELTEWVGDDLPKLRGQNITGDQIARYMAYLDRAVTTNPREKEALVRFLQTGEYQPTMPKSDEGDDDDDAYLTEEQREIRELRQQLQEMRGQIGSVTSSNAQTALKNHLEKVAGELGLSGERFEKVRTGIGNVIESWGRDPQHGRAALQRLMTPQGEKTVRGLVLEQLGTEDLDALFAERLRRKGQGLASLATDGPSEIASQGDEPMPEHKSALEALKMARAKPEVLDRIYGNR